MTVVIGFSRAKNKYALFSRLIESIEKRPFSHAYVRFLEPRSNQEMVFQAAHGIVNLFNYNKFLEKNTVVKEYNLNCTEEQFDDLWSFMMTSLGTSYGWRQLLGLGLNRLIHIENPFKDELATEICSELAARVCTILGVAVFVDYDSISPGDLELILRDNI